MAVEDPNDLPVRSNGQEIRASWFNSLRDYFIIALGAIRVQKSVTLLNNTTTFVTALTYDATEEISATIKYDISRESDTDAKVRQTGTLEVAYNSATGNWSLEEGPKFFDTPGVTWAIEQGLSTARVSYTTTSYDPTGYVGRLDFKGGGFLL